MVGVPTIVKTTLSSPFYILKPMTEILALIPARGGSKGIPRKNIKSFAGYPLVAWSIAAGLQANSISRVIVSTDDEEIAAVSREYGADIPFLRPAEFAQDRSPDLPTFEHALKWVADFGPHHLGFNIIKLKQTLNLLICEIENHTSSERIDDP